MTPRLLTLACTLLPTGCIPDPDLPACTVDEDCWRHAGFCSCRSGLCFKFDCPPGWPGDASAGTEPDAPGPPEASGACDAGGDRTSVPACTIAAGDLDAAQTAVLPPAIDGDGRLYVVSSAKGVVRLSAFDAELKPLFSKTIGSGAAQPRHAPLVRQTGGVAVTTADGIVTFDTGGTGTPQPLGGAPASAPVERANGALIVILDSGRIAELGASGQVATSTTPVVAPGASAHACLFDAGTLATTDASGTFGIVDLGAIDDAALVWTWQEGKAATPPVAGGKGVYAVTASGDLGGAVAVSQQWKAVGPVSAGTSPHAPVVATGEVVIVASGTEKRITAAAYTGSDLKVEWTATGAALADVPSTPPLVDGNGDVVVGLGNGFLVTLRPGAGEATPLWTFDLGDGAAGAPVQWPDGSLLHLSGSGSMRRLVGGPAGDGHPWPRARHDRRATGRAAP